jgi:hypothetical protein
VRKPRCLSFSVPRIKFRCVYPEPVFATHRRFSRRTTQDQPGFGRYKHARGRLWLHCTELQHNRLLASKPRGPGVKTQTQQFGLEICDATCLMQTDFLPRQALDKRLKTQMKLKQPGGFLGEGRRDHGRDGQHWLNHRNIPLLVLPARCDDGRDGRNAWFRCGVGFHGHRRPRRDVDGTSSKSPNRVFVLNPQIN